MQSSLKMFYKTQSVSLNYGVQFDVVSHRKKTARVCLFKLLMKLFSSPVFTVLARCQRQLLSASGPAYSGVSQTAPRNLPVRTFAAVK